MQRTLNSFSHARPGLVALLLPVVVLLLSSGCTSVGAESAGYTRDFATTAVTTAAGGYVGAKEGDDRAKNAAVGAAAGFVVGEAINYLSNKAQREAFLAGYEKGQSNAVKQQYWLARDNQRPSLDDGYEEGYYEIAVPQADRDGVRREATTRVIRVVMPKEETRP